jgi:RNA polymerase sigma-70 factor (ECF subfamily)
VSIPAALAPGSGTTTPADRLASLWNAHYPAVLAYARRRAPEEMANDAASAAFTVLWRRIDEPLDDPLPWLLAVARRELANQRRGEARRRRLGIRARTAAATEPDAADRAVDQAQARAALARLRPDDREVLMLVAWEGLDPTRAATVLGISPAAFAVRLHRARRRLESHLKSSEESAR